MAKKPEINFKEIDKMTDDQLAEYLISRFEHAVFAGYRIDNNKNDEMLLRYEGDSHVCYKLGGVVQNVVDQDSTPIIIKIEEEERFYGRDE